MPYSIQKRGNKYCVVSPTRTHGCHDSREKATKQLRALWRNAPESADGGASMSTVESASFARGIMTNLTSTSLSPAQIKAGTTATTLLAAAATKEPEREPWSGILGIEWSPTRDNRVLELNQISHADLPVPFSVQLQKKEGHDDAWNCGRIEEISRIPIEEFRKREDADDFDLSEVRDGAIVLYGTGSLDLSEYADHAKRLIENGSGVSLDGLRYSGKFYDKEDLAEIEIDPNDMGAMLEIAMSDECLRGVNGEIGGVTVVDIAAFREAKVLVASASMAQIRFFGSADGEIMDGDEVVGYTFNRSLTAAAAPVKPPAEWFANPHLTELTPLTITPEGRVYGHLADWDGCHVGFQGVCVPPFRSSSDFAYFNTGVIQTAEGHDIPCGKIMFCMKGNGHAPTDESLGYEDVQAYYDDATKVGALVRAGADHLGTWLAGSLRPGLSEIEVQHLRSHPPSGDWRQIKNGPTELIAAFSVPVGGFPIPRRALVASADGQITTIITAPLQVSEDMGYRRRKVKRIMLQQRLDELLGPRLGTRERIREDLYREISRDE